ncbi:hypothetical protein BJM84_02635 [Listeria monocytogenes]|nr:hypothetical protein [Listeria monocytogenes]EAD0739963.1 hypothetical protein [Listeria monocytogenes]EAD9140324.1 hypothetical protein [Listeria monocytogenes]MBC6364013.1 hypothetical protein [Listeria monocytogenes]MCM64200.1 hypothetical protein [Listeria monocytogenes]
MEFIHQTETKVFAVCSKCSKKIWIGTNLSYNCRVAIAEKFGFQREGNNLYCGKCIKNMKRT